MADTDAPEADPRTAAPSDDTVAADREEATTPHEADRPPTPEEEAAAEKNTLDPAVAANIEEAAARGANVRGEGQIEPPGG